MRPNPLLARASPLPQLLCWPPRSHEHGIPLSKGFVSVWSEEMLWGWKHMLGGVSVHHLFFAVNGITLNQSHAILPNAATEVGKS